MNNVQEISPEKVADLTIEENSEVLFYGAQANVIKGNNAELGEFIIINLPMGDSILISSL